MYNWESGESYSGMFKENGFDGHGLYCFDNGSTYSGYFRQTQMDGVGTLTDKNGDVYVGEFKKDKKWVLWVLADWVIWASRLRTRWEPML